VNGPLGVSAATASAVRTVAFGRSECGRLNTLIRQPAELTPMTVVPDTSVIIDGRVSERVEAGDYEGEVVLVPEVVVGELESQANAGRDSGWEGLEELQRLATLVDEGVLELEYVGRRASQSERRSAHEGDVDAIVRDVAEEREATLLTSDVVQAEVARAKRIEVDYLEPRGRDTEHLTIEEFFDEGTMSVHLRSGTRPRAKRGTIGEMHYETIREEPSTEEELREYAHDVEESARAHPEGFVELEEPGMTIVQFREFRIAIARPPFADGFEITAVRPIAKTDIEEYAHADDLKDRLLERQRGVLISGAPGAGKSTFAQAVAEFLHDNDFAVKTMEKPRDLQVGPEITQYTALGGEMAKTADSLLMVRPDYTIYDEVRKTDDFEVFADMRLAGVGMVGVVHATRAIDALQRLVGRVELGMIPQVVDTVVYIEAGSIDTVYDVTTEVKVPEGLTAEDLARPVITISDFETGRAAYEIYTFNRQVVTVPLTDEGTESGVSRLARQEIEREIRSIARGHVDVRLQGSNKATVYVEEDDISYVIGKGGGRIQDIEDRLGLEIDVRTHDENPDVGENGGGGGGASGGSAPAEGEIVTPEVTSRHVVIRMDEHVGETVEVRADGEYLFTATVGRGGDVQVSRGSAIADELERAIDRKKRITVVPA
jgi:ATPase